MTRRTAHVVTATLVCLAGVWLGGCRLTKRRGATSATAAEVVRRSVAAPPTARQRARLKPARYILRVVLADDLTSFHGEETIVFTNTRQAALSETVLELYPNASFFPADEGPLLTLQGVHAQGRAVRAEQQGEFVTIPLPHPLKGGEKAAVRFHFSGRVPLLPVRKRGLSVGLLQELLFLASPRYKGQFGIYGYGGGVLNLGHWFPRLSRLTTTGWDRTPACGVGDVTNSDVANYDVTLTVPAGVVVAATGTRVLRRATDGTQRSRYYAGLARDFAVECSRRFTVATKRQKGVTIRSYFLPEHVRGGRRALNLAAACLEFYRQVGPYVYRDLDVVEAPLLSGAGGMEYPGLVLLNSLLYAVPPALTGGEGSKTELSRYWDDMFEFVVAHEVAHQWWYAAVGSDSKQHPFVDEALANYSALCFCESHHSKRELATIRYVNLELGYQLHRALGGADGPVDQPASAFPGMMAYNALVYCKGALYYDALRKLMGDRAFGLFLRNYYAEHRYGTVGPDDIVEAARQATADKQAVDLLSERWLHGTHGDEDIGRLRLVQFWDLFLGDVIPDEAAKSDLRSLMKRLDDLRAVGQGPSFPEASQTVSNLLKLLQGEGEAAWDQLLRKSRQAGKREQAPG